MRWIAAGALALLMSSCAVKQPQVYRLVTRDGGNLLVPPGAMSAPVPERIFTSQVRVVGKCAGDRGPVRIEARGKRLKVTVNREQLGRQPSAWLRQWAASLEASGCIAAGMEWTLATEVAESVALEPNVAFRLVYGEAVDVESMVRIQVDSPILRDDNDQQIFETRAVQGTESGLQMTLKTTENLLGYERAWYGVEPKANGAGLRISPLRAERHINGQTETRPQPAKNQFAFADAAGFYRLLIKQEQTEFRALVVAGRSRRELDRNAKLTAGGAASCTAVEAGF